MKETLALARVGLSELRAGLEATRARLATERRELETVRRRKGLAASIRDAETVTVAERFERQHEDRVAVLERKRGAQEAELMLAEGEVDAMAGELRATIGNGTGAAGAMPPVGDEGSSRLRDELEALGRRGGRAAREAEAVRKLAELKRRMGK